MFNFLKKNKDGQLVDFFIDYVTTHNSLTNLAFEIAGNKISDVIAKCGFDVIAKNEKEKNELIYLLNVKPNVNENATNFWKQVVHRMIIDEEGALVVHIPKRGLFLADSWLESNDVMTNKTYSNIQISVNDDVFRLEKTFSSDEVLLLKYSNSRLLQLLRKTNELNETAWKVAINGFKVKAPKYKVVTNAQVGLMNQITNKPMTTNEYADSIKEKLNSADIQTILAGNGIDVTVIDGKSGLSTADIKTMKDEIFSTTAIAFGIPETVFYGKVTEKSDANNEFITYACEPLIEIINNAICGLWLSSQDYAKGERIYINTTRVKHIDVIESAGNLDKLYQNGWSHNDIMKLLNLPQIDEKWANERRFTKNYTADTKGGE